MTRDEIISMAREAGASFETAESMFRFAALVAAGEREACAKAAETCFVGWPMDGGEQRHVCARAIRARGDACLP